MHYTRFAAVATFVVSAAFLCNFSNAADAKKPAAKPATPAKKDSPNASGKELREGKNVILTAKKSGAVISANVKGGKIIGFSRKGKDGKVVEVKSVDVRSKLRAGLKGKTLRDGNYVIYTDMKSGTSISAKVKGGKVTEYAPSIKDGTVLLPGDTTSTSVTIGSCTYTYTVIEGGGHPEGRPDITLGDIEMLEIDCKDA